MPTHLSTSTSVKIINYTSEWRYLQVFKIFQILQGPFYRRDLVVLNFSVGRKQDIR